MLEGEEGQWVEAGRGGQEQGQGQGWGWMCRITNQGVSVRFRVDICSALTIALPLCLPALSLRRLYRNAPQLYRLYRISL